MASIRFVHKIYQYYQLSTSFLFAALLARFIVLAPLVSLRFLPGGIHEFLIYLILYATIGEIFWLFKFRGVKNGIFSRTFIKDLNFLYFVLVMHFYDDYEHALILKNMAYSYFIVGLSTSQGYYHWTQIFKRAGFKERTLLWKIYTYVSLPLLYFSEFYLLLLNVQNPGYHTTPLLNKINKVVLVLFFPIALSLYKKQI